MACRCSWFRFGSVALIVTLLLVPSRASAATAYANPGWDTPGGPGPGPVTLTARAGETNRVTVTGYEEAGFFVATFHDSANPVEATGACDQVDKHTAACPTRLGKQVSVRLFDRNDRATIEADVSAGRSKWACPSTCRVDGGSGDDVLRGSDSSEALVGGSGDDELHGGRGWDKLIAGPGRDRAFGGGGGDHLIDGETDRRAARDVLDGGLSPNSRYFDPGDTVSYARRRHALDINLSRRPGLGPDGDVLRGVESLVGGSGDDRLHGDGDENSLAGERGDDRLTGGDGDDNLSGGDGNDRLAGGGGDDELSDDPGKDRVAGGGGSDKIRSVEDYARPSAVSDDVSCGHGSDEVQPSWLDVIRGCEVAETGGLRIGPAPEVSGSIATFAVSNAYGEGRKIALSSLDGDDFGAAEFTPGDTRVAMKLTAAGRRALRRGAVVQLSVVSPPDSCCGMDGGFRTFMGG